MKKLLVLAILLCGNSSFARAQESVSATVSTNAAADFTVTSGARTPLVKPMHLDEPVFVADALDSTASSARPAVTTALAVPETSLASVPEPAASPLHIPKLTRTALDDYRYELALGVSLERFRSSIYRATAVGTNTSLTYFWNDWLGIEGNISTFFAPTIYQAEHIKLVNYGAGPKITWRQTRYEPFVHLLLGGTHAIPKTAGNSKNGFAMQLGGGVDYRLFPRLSVRGELNYVPSRLFGAWQHNFETAVSGVLHF
jgi:opacity protein-like surface antigen